MKCKVLKKYIPHIAHTSIITRYECSDYGI